MKDRIAHIIRAKNLTAAEFALRLGIQPSNISHLLSGRNNPSLDFVKKLKETFPEYNLDWIVFGKGPMTVSEPFLEPKPLDVSQPVDAQKAMMESDGLEPNLFSVEKLPDKPVVNEARPSVPPLKQIVLVYEDNSFEVLSPR
ncbi:MAG: helix-turn-helix transcriptional regulator [Bacteroidales bacterium]|nr:helix-turn-helix transcriptional regulator [Bacteroidales bacterium]